MPHNIDFDALTQESKFASRRQPAWHRLGQVCDKDFMTPSELAAQAHILGNDVHVEDWSNITAGDKKAGDSSQNLLLPGYDFSEEFLVTVRTNPVTGRKEVIEKVGAKYVVIQTEDMVELADVYSQQFNASAETAGSLNGGRAVFLSLALDSDIIIDPNGPADKVKNYLLLTNSFDGSVAFGGLNTPVRVVCQNTLNYAMSGTKQDFTIRHTKTAHDRIAEAKMAAQVNAAYRERFAASATALYEAKMTDNQFWKVIEFVHGETPDEETAAGNITKWANNAADLMTLWHGDTVAGAGIGRTGWGAINAVTEAGQWLRNIRKDNPEAFVMAGAGLRKDVTNKRTEVFDFVTEMLDIKVADLKVPA